MTIYQPLTKAISTFLKDGFNIVGELPGRAVNSMSLSSLNLHHNRIVAFATFFFANAAIFAISYRSINGLANRFDNKDGSPLSNRQLAVKHIVLSIVVGGSALVTSVVLSKIIEYPLTKAVLAAITVAAVAARYLLKFCLELHDTIQNNGIEEPDYDAYTENLMKRGQRKPDTEKNAEADTDKQDLEKMEAEKKAKEEADAQKAEIEKLEQKKIEEEKKAEEAADAQKAEEEATKKAEVEKLEQKRIEDEKKAEEEAVAKKAEEEAVKKAKAEEVRRAEQAERERIWKAQQAYQARVAEVHKQATAARIEAAKELKVPYFEFCILPPSGSQERILITCQTNGDYQTLDEILLWRLKFNRELCVYDRVGDESMYTGMTQVILRISEPTLPSNYRVRTFDHIKENLCMLQGKHPKSAVQEITDEQMYADIDAAEAARKEAAIKMDPPKFTFATIKKQSPKEEGRVLITCESNADLRKLNDKLKYCTNINDFCIFDCVDGQSVHTGATQFIARVSTHQQNWTNKGDKTIPVKTTEDLIAILSDLKGTLGDELVRNDEIKDMRISHSVKIYDNIHEKRTLELIEKAGLKKEDFGC